MDKKLVIVESPKKAKTIAKFLGDDYIVKSSYGHVRDLPKSEMGIDIENETFEPHYEIDQNKAERVTELKNLASKCSEVIFATDEDREGEAISWHLAHIFEIDPDDATRIVFHEITKDAISEALANPRSIDKKLVDAQQARRVLDRLVGYELSPLLWKKVAKGLSAGRVQSAALRFVVERERDRQKFEPKEYWSLKANLNKNNKDLEAKLYSENGEKLDKFAITSEDDMNEVLDNLDGDDYIIDSIKNKERKRNPKPPFTTSDLQRSANNRLGFSSSKTMTIAQQLYEGIELGNDQVGLITYMRTDSKNLSDNFLGRTHGFIENRFSEKYSQFRKYSTDSNQAQEAHEAIRPTDPFRNPKSIKNNLTKDQQKLYTLIWKRALATQMATAIMDRKTIMISAKNYEFRATGQTIKFDGWLKLYPKRSKEKTLPKLKEQDKLACKELEPKQHFTKPPARYSDATLVKELKKHEIGRPSTYAPTISKIEARDYVERTKNKRIKPKNIAFVVNDLLVNHFSNIVDSEFTAEMEEKLDKIAQGKQDWKPIIENFYYPFHENLEEKEEKLTKQDVTEVEHLGEHPETEKPIMVRVGQYGPYVQMGTKDDDQKPKFASIPEEENIHSITKDQAIKMLSLPRELGEDDNNNKIIVDEGRYGPYIKVDDNYYSLDDENPYEVDLKDAKQIIKEKKKEEKKKEIQVFNNGKIKVLDGPYGPYITDGSTNISVPDDEEPDKISRDKCKELIKKNK
jgi:DNA topoisomerase-1